ncbi:MAG: alpha/beta hydrolase-fold protein [Gammaproteobacteria bacterium]|nr:alpha/beta hydrolase-fold protein [Gammaproteobacteria bacterium]
MLALLLLLAAASCVAQARPATAGMGVRVLGPPLAIPGLDRTRTIRIYLPPGYDDSRKRYRVLYMFDAQNLFDDATSFVGEWGVDESLDALAKSDGIELIVVGIDHGDDKRISELRPWAHPRFGKAEGDQFLDFVVGTVKPFVDRNYRTHMGRKDTGIAGSSLGGLMAHYAVLRHPDVFGRVAIFSPAYWIADEIYPATEAGRLKRGTRIYLVAGDKEGQDEAGQAKNVDKVRKMESLLQDAQGRRIELKTVIRPGAGHGEATWRSEFPAAIRFLFGDPSRRQ